MFKTFDIISNMTEKKKIALKVIYLHSPTKNKKNCKRKNLTIYNI